ncbi:hypothetical protein ACP70R_038746 [Stipagrostis hirtigluma subsp. patula]
MARNPGRTVYIGNLDEKVSERVLYEILIQAGPVVDLHMPCDKETNRPKGFAFAEYVTEEIAQYAVRLFSGLVRINGRILKFAISGHDKPTSNGNNPVMPKLNPIPKPRQFVHCSNMPVSGAPAYPVVNGGIAGHGLPLNFYPYGFHTQGPALSGGPVHSHGELSNSMYDYSRHAFGSFAYKGPVVNAFAHGAPAQPIMYPSY